MEMDALVEAVQPTPPTESVVIVRVEAPRPPVLDVTTLEEAVQGPSASSDATPVARISPRKAQLQVLAATKPPVGRMEAQEIDCPNVKWPAALPMQNVEGFLVKTGQRELWLGSRRNAAGKELTADLYTPDCYNTASPDMLTPKERKRLKDMRESEIPSVKFDDLGFREKSRCWSTSQACSVKIVDKDGMKTLPSKLNLDKFCKSDYKIVIDSRLAAMTSVTLYKERELGNLQRDFEPRAKRNESQMLTSWSIRALSVQVDITLAFFGLINKDLNCINSRRTPCSAEFNGPVLESIDARRWHVCHD